MLKFVRGFNRPSQAESHPNPENKNSNTTIHVNEIVLEEEEVEDNATDIDISFNSQANDLTSTKTETHEDESTRNLKQKSKKLKLIILAIICSLIALIILTIFLVCILKFDFKPTMKQKPSWQNSNKTCSRSNTCPTGQFSLISTNKCTCQNLNNCFILNQSNSSNSTFISNCKGLSCTITNTTHTCSCAPGFTWSNENKTCTDLNECLDFKCTNDTSTGLCLNSKGSFSCQCKPGFIWSSQFEFCIDINECDQAQSPCRTNNSICVNTFGSFQCDCQTGFFRLNQECVDIDECSFINRTCNSKTTCLNKPGVYECCEKNSTECHSCGHQYYTPSLNPTARIIGGFEAKPNSWPWLVSIGINYKYRVFDSKQNKEVVNWYNVTHICGGSLISASFVLTAAHCVHDLEANLNSLSSELVIKPNRFHADMASVLTVYVGIHDQEVDKSMLSRAFKVKSVVMHEGYDSRMYLNDIALLKLERSVARSDTVDWICFGDYKDMVYPEVNTIVYAVGFGSTNEMGYAKGSNLLRQVDLKLLEFKKCEIVTLFMITDPKSQVCAGHLDGEKDTCTGDSGSPIMYFFKNKWFVIGLVSYGQGCGQLLKPGVNTNVSFYANWIKSKMKS